MQVQFGDERLPTRFWDKVSPEPNSGCWLWSAAVSHGYGNFGTGGRLRRKTVYAHRLVMALGQPVGPDDQVLHRCDNPYCCNPDHLFVGDTTANMRDMVAKGRHRLMNRPAENAAKTHCKRGHPLSGDNLRIRSDGSRICRVCRATIEARFKAKRKKNGHSNC